MLAGKRPDRPVLFELILNEALVREVTGLDWTDSLGYDIALTACCARLGYDCSVVLASDLHFPTKARSAARTVSLNQGAVISDRESFERYPWPSAKDFPTSRLDALKESLPEGMKLLIWSPDGLLETVIRLVGYEDLSMMLYDDPDLFKEIFDAVGTRLYDYFAGCVTHPAVGGLISSDDWGFYNQTFFSPQVMREVLFPWQARYIDLAYAHGKPMILHSCGELRGVMDDIVSLGFDAKHSFEDKIWPIEQALETLQGRIAVLGGIDMDYICRSKPEEIYQRAAALLRKSGGRGYALGTGNSVPDYVPRQNYYAMLQAAFDAAADW